MTLVADSSIEHFGFFLVPGFSMISLAAVVDPLRMANRISDKELYTWDFYCHHDETITASNGLPFSPSRKQNDIRDLDTLFVVAGIDAHQANDASLLSWLRSLKQQKINLGSTSTGSLLLAKAGILKNQRCTIHWENQDSLSEQFPDLQVTGELYEIDRLNKGLPRLKNFILPGGSVLSAHTHLARCVCRRAERRVVTLENEEYSVILQYLNRLSDYLFILSREFLRLENKEEVIWQKG